MKEKEKWTPEPRVNAVLAVLYAQGPGTWLSARGVADVATDRIGLEVLQEASELYDAEFRWEDWRYSTVNSGVSKLKEYRELERKKLDYNGVTREAVLSPGHRSGDVDRLESNSLEHALIVHVSETGSITVGKAAKKYGETLDDAEDTLKELVRMGVLDRRGVIDDDKRWQEYRYIPGPGTEHAVKHIREQSSEWY